MEDRKLYQVVLGLPAPWKVDAVELNAPDGEIVVRVGLPGGTVLRCPECSMKSPRYDYSEERRWRHLDTCQYRTILVCRVPRVKCAEHGVKQVQVPWAEGRSRFTMEFERKAIDVLGECSIDGAARVLRASWEEVAGIQRRAVQRGLSRRTHEPVRVIGVDETSFQKRHEYVTILIDVEGDRVLWVGDDRKSATLQAGLASLSKAQLEQLEALVMDLWDPYVAAARIQFPDTWREMIVFDRYHVMALLNRALEEVRRWEQRTSRLGHLLKGARFALLRGKRTRKRKHHRIIAKLKEAAMHVGRAWTLRESIAGLWDYKTLRYALRFFANWFALASRSKLAPIERAARTIQSYLYGILNYIQHPFTNARTEAMNAKIQQIKYRARGYRNRESFRMAIMFHCGGLDLYPR